MTLIAWDNIEDRALLIVETARRMIGDEYADWEGYCLPGCQLCAIELASDRVDEEHGWADIEDARVAGDAAMRLARDLMEGTRVEDHLRG